MRPMRVRKLFRFLLAVLVTAGLTVAPLANPAVAEQSMAPVTVQMDDMPDMAADMPCCPDKQKSSDCLECPLVATCILKVLQIEPSTGVVLMRDPSRQRLHLLDDAVVDGLSRPPPDQPPRYWV